jgi:hypothetical protein
MVPQREVPPAFIQQASAARLIGEISSTSLPRAVQLLELGALHGLVIAAANLDCPESQVASCLTLRICAKLVIEAEEALSRHLGESVFFKLIVRLLLVADRSCVTHSARWSRVTQKAPPSR